MGFGSYSEDILKRHQSDMHDLIRELETGHLSEAQQNHALPQFQDLVEKLGQLLSDPAQPVAMRLLELRSKATSLAFEVEQLKAKNDKLGTTNGKLNEQVRWLGRDILVAREAYKTQVRRTQELEKQIQSLKADLTKGQKANAEQNARIKRLEQLAMEAQVDVRFRPYQA